MTRMLYRIITYNNRTGPLLPCHKSGVRFLGQQIQYQAAEIEQN
ncbi:hypothetical protein SPHINGO391_500120 [Sphingomonas aurantiaca]|uniref:Uncharacterized protein n=1 Tax=Sphingomonas aurantiaca TaxID=185949 RepID=A0A5E8AAI4_9SPHN|nr:hypothetical protein SPHINGO391_500120 [Sphingomonas aurantiaca]